MENIVVFEDKEAEKHMREVFGVSPSEKVSFEAGETLEKVPRELEMVDALGGKVTKERTIKRPEEFWGEKVAAVVQARIEQAIRYRKWVV